MKTLINIFVLLFLFASMAGAQNLPFRNYSIEDGLSEAVVNTITQDDEGYLWIGTGYEPV